MRRLRHRSRARSNKCIPKTWAANRGLILWQSQNLLTLLPGGIVPLSCQPSSEVPMTPFLEGPHGVHGIGATDHRCAGLSPETSAFSSNR